MNGEGLYIDPASMKALDINIKRFTQHVLKAAHQGLKAFGQAIINQAKDFIDHNDQVASGLLRNSGRAVSQPDGTVDAGFYVGYAEHVEYGRKAGGMPPVDDIIQWLRRKGKRRGKNSALQSAAAFTGKSEEQLRRDAAWAIAKSIKENGTQPHPFLKPAYEIYRNKIDEFMRKKVNEAVEQFKPKK